MKKILCILTFTVTLFTLILGLNFKDEDFNNKILVMDDSLRFKSGSFAFSNFILPEESIQNLNKNGFVLNFVIKPENSSSRKTRFLFRFGSNFNPDNTLNVFFWKNQLIVNVGNDFSYKKKSPRVSAYLENKKYNIDILVAKSFMSLYVEKQLLKTIRFSNNNGFYFHSADLDVILGGHLVSEKSWRGDLFSLSFSEILGGAPNIKDDLNILLAKSVYTFNFDQVDIDNYYPDFISGAKLVLPKYPVKYQRELLRYTSFMDVMNAVTVVDIVVNFCWFFLLSILLFLCLKSFGFSLNSSFFLSFLFSFSLSLLIEYLQSWLPMRDSSARDLLLNSTGGFLGSVFIYVGVLYYRI